MNRKTKWPNSPGNNSKAAANLYGELSTLEWGRTFAERMPSIRKKVQRTNRKICLTITRGSFLFFFFLLRWKRKASILRPLCRITLGSAWLSAVGSTGIKFDKFYISMGTRERMVFNVTTTTTVCGSRVLKPYVYISAHRLGST